jgi:glyoxylase-like metal-dependent hydrolase (beta-lactamase superfamily II)
MLLRDVAEGVHQLTVSHTNVYLVEHEGGILLVDAGLPAFWPHLLIALKELGVDPTSVSGVLLTHAHFDHVGCVQRVRREWNVPVWHHAADTALLAHPYRYDHERARLPYAVRFPRNLPALWDFALAGALVVHGATDGSPLGADLQLPASALAGSGTATGPVVLATPGHTAGHIALHLPDRDALLVGDAIVTLDPYTGATGPQIVAGAATADSTRALRSLETLAATGATTVLPGHGAAWTGGISEAVAAAWTTGAH